MKETANFRDALARLDEAFPNKELLTMREVGQYLGKSYNWVARHIPKTTLGISKIALAKLM